MVLRSENSKTSSTAILSIQTKLFPSFVESSIELQPMEEGTFSLAHSFSHFIPFPFSINLTNHATFVLLFRSSNWYAYWKVQSLCHSLQFQLCTRFPFFFHFTSKFMRVLFLVFLIKQIMHICLICSDFSNQFSFRY